MAWPWLEVRAGRGHGMAIHVNGKRICNVDTLHALERLGLVEQLVVHSHKAIGEWQATQAGRDLTGHLVRTAAK